MKNIFDYIKESILDDFDVIDKKTNTSIIKAWFEENAKGNYKVKITKAGGCTINGDVIIKGYSGESFPELNILELNGNLSIEKCPNLKTTNGLFSANISTVNGGLAINNCPKLTNLLSMPWKVDGDFQLVGNSSLRNLEGAPQLIHGNIMIMKNSKRFSVDYIRSIIKYSEVASIYCSEEDIEANINEGEELNEAVNNPYLSLLIQQLKEKGIKFKSVIRNLGYSIKWEQVDSSNIKKFEWRYKKPDNKHLTAAREIISGKVAGFILVYKYDENNKIKFTDIINDNKYTFEFNSTRWQSKKSTDIIDKICGVYGYPATDGMIIVYISNDLKAYELKREREQAQAGMVTNTPEYYRSVAQANLDRYKKIIAKNKATRGTKDVENLQNKVNLFLQKIMQASTNVMKNPSKYAERLYYLDALNSLAYDKQSWSAKGAMGKDGVLVLFNKYMNRWGTTAIGKSYSYFGEDTDKLLKVIEKDIDSIISSADRYLEYFDVK